MFFSRILVKQAKTSVLLLMLTIVVDMFHEVKRSSESVSVILSVRTIEPKRLKLQSPNLTLG